MAKYRHYKPSKEELERERKEAEKREDLIIAAMDRWDIDDILDVMSDRVQQSRQSTKDAMLEKMAEIMNANGYSIIKTDNLYDAYMLKDLVTASMFRSEAELNNKCLFAD